MQNARRAGATYVHFAFYPETGTLSVWDDGCGIDTIGTLLTVAGSGWDATVVETEHPFGIGFMSALFSCRRIKVHSKSGEFEAETADILAFHPIEIQPVETWSGLTYIVLSGIDINHSELRTSLETLSKGFPITVSLHGEEFDRPHSLDRLNAIETGVGMVSFRESGPKENIFGGRPISLYLQGLPVYSTRQSGQSHVIHLDSAKFFARMPDRDKLIDQAEVLKLVDQTLHGLAKDHYSQLKAVLTPEEFVTYYHRLEMWGLLLFLNDIDILPTQAVELVDDYPVLRSYSQYSRDKQSAVIITRQDVENGKVQIVRLDDDIHTDGAARWMYAYVKGCYRIDRKLDQAHWLYSHVRDLNQEDVNVKTLGESHSAFFNGNWVWVDTVFCETYQVTVGNDTVEIHYHPVYLGEEVDDRIIMPKQAFTPSEVLEQVSSFKDENDYYQEAVHNEDMEKFAAFTAANVSSCPASALRRLMPDFEGCPIVYARSFVVDLDESGKVSSVSLAAA